MFYLVYFIFAPFVAPVPTIWKQGQQNTRKAVDYSKNTCLEHTKGQWVTGDSIIIEYDSMTCTGLKNSLLVKTVYCVVYLPLGT